VTNFNPEVLCKLNWSDKVYELERSLAHLFGIFPMISTGGAVGACQRDIDPSSF
jgi:hypothetical protein